MGHQLRLRARYLGKAILEQLCHLLVILLPGALQQRLVSRILDQRMLEQIARARRATALVEQLVDHQLTETALQHLFFDPRQRTDHVVGKLASTEPNCATSRSRGARSRRAISESCNVSGMCNCASAPGSRE